MEVSPPHLPESENPAPGSPPFELESSLPAPAEPEHMQVRLPPEFMSPTIARNLVADACRAWQLVPLLYPGRAVISELVANAVEHARTDIDVTVSLREATSERGATLHLAVRDGCRLPPRILELAAPVAGRPLNERGHGMRVVEADSVDWGVLPAKDGKVVWAVVRSRDSHSRRW
jgi:anti-sigma regulatory factor (Ser/Thr protein kinase)